MRFRCSLDTVKMGSGCDLDAVWSRSGFGQLGSTSVNLGLLGSTWVCLGPLGFTWVHCQVIAQFRTVKAISGRDGMGLDWIGRDISQTVTPPRAPGGANKNTKNDINIDKEHSYKYSSECR